MLAPCVSTGRTTIGIGRCRIDVKCRITQPYVQDIYKDRHHHTLNFPNSKGPQTSLVDVFRFRID